MSQDTLVLKGLFWGATDCQCMDKLMRHGAHMITQSSAPQCRSQGPGNLHCWALSFIFAAPSLAASDPSLYALVGACRISSLRCQQIRLDGHQGLALLEEEAPLLNATLGQLQTGHDSSKISNTQDSNDGCGDDAAEVLLTLMIHAIQEWGMYDFSYSHMHDEESDVSGDAVDSDSLKLTSSSIGRRYHKESDDNHDDDHDDHDHHHYVNVRLEAVTQLFGRMVAWACKLAYRRQLFHHGLLTPRISKGKTIAQHDCTP